MTGSELIAEAERLARPRVLLRSEGETDCFAAVWGGTGLVPSPEGPFRHWLSVDCAYFPEDVESSTGCLSIYANEDDCESGVVVVDRSRKLSTERGGIKLYAHSSRSLPPIDAVFRFGSPAVHEWLRSKNWPRDWGYSDNFSDPKPVEDYERLYQSECPLYSGGAHAALGGWHFPWPGGDWEQLLDHQLLAWTFEDSEPWIEVWRFGDDLQVKQRIT